MHIVRQIKKYTRQQVEQAIFSVGYFWRHPKDVPRSIDRMVQGMPRCELEKVLVYLQGGNYDE